MLEHAPPYYVLGNNFNREGNKIQRDQAFDLTMDFDHLGDLLPGKGRFHFESYILASTGGLSGGSL